MDPRLSADVARLSTDDLALTLAVVQRLRQGAAERKEARALRDWDERASLIQRELETRQLRLLG